jgi:hypothetical protein
MWRGEYNPSVVEIFQTMDEHGTVLFIEEVFSYFDYIIGTYAEKI